MKLTPLYSAELTQHQKESLTAGLLSAPALLLLLVFLITPFLMALGLSFTDQRLIPNPHVPTELTGLANFLRMFQDPTFYQAIFNNFCFAIVVVPVQTAFALLLAMLVNQKIKGVQIFRTIYFSPVVVTLVVVSVIWTFLYHPEKGFVNELLQTLSLGLLGPVDWLNDPRFALPGIMILSIWQGVGFQMVIYLAGLQDIPERLYEAAQLDGASSWQQFIHITLPQLRNKTIFVALATTILAFKLFTQVWVMHGPTGQPRGSTMTMLVYTVSQGFKQGKIGYACAITVTFFMIVLIVSLVQRLFLREEREVS